MEPNSILVVDDDSDDRFLLKTAFNDLGYTNLVCFAESGEKALNYLEGALEIKELPRLVVLDLNMPKMTGTQLLKRIKSHTVYKDIDVIIFSTAVNDFEKNECLSSGAVGYLVKPINYNGFLETVQSFHAIASAV